jgi:hypothetical protein
MLQSNGSADGQPKVAKNQYAKLQDITFPGKTMFMGNSDFAEI